LIRAIAACARGGLHVALAGCLAIGFLAAAGSALAEISQDQAARKIASDYNVKVLRVKPGKIDGRAVWLVTVMNPGGNYNEAFQVTTLAVDQADGRLVPSFRNGPSETEGAAGAVDTQIDRRPSVMRSGPWR
jgi:hypothetical protein